MNFFYLVTCWWELSDECKRVMVLSLCNLHANKMLLETVQLLYTANHQLYGDGKWCVFAPNKGYRATHKKHPVSLWASELGGNWFALLEYAEMLGEEYVRRFRGGDRSQSHKCSQHVRWLRANHHKFFDETKLQRTEPPVCVGEPYKKVDVEPLRPLLQHPMESHQSEAVLRYRLYYVLEKLYRRDMMNIKGGGYRMLQPVPYKRGEMAGKTRCWKKGHSFIPPRWIMHSYMRKEQLAALVPETE